MPCTSSVWPSGADFATESMFGIPGRFSTVTGWPQSCASLSVTTRPNTSTVLPTGYGITTRTPFVGKDGSGSSDAHPAAARVAKVAINSRIESFMCTSPSDVMDQHRDAAALQHCAG